MSDRARRSFSRGQQAGRNALRERLEGRRALHHYNYGSTQRGDERGVEAFNECVHPVFRTHEETGRKAVYVNRLMTVKILDMEPAESNFLLNALFNRTKLAVTLFPEQVSGQTSFVGNVIVTAADLDAKTELEGLSVTLKGCRPGFTIVAQV